MRKPSDEFRIEETNALLGQVPGMAAFAPGKQRVTGGKGAVMDHAMKVADTNKLVESITGGGLSSLQESGPASPPAHRPLFESQIVEGSMEDAATDLIGDTGTKGAVQRLIVALEGFQEVSMDPEMGGDGTKDATIENDIKVLKGILGHLKHVR